MRTFYFTNRVVDAWNSLPNWVVSANNINAFLKRLDQHLQMNKLQTVVYMDSSKRALLCPALATLRYYILHPAFIRTWVWIRGHLSTTSMLASLVRALHRSLKGRFEKLFENMGIHFPHSSQLEVLWHNHHLLGVDRTLVGVLKQTHQVSLARLLQSHHC